MLSVAEVALQAGVTTAAVRARLSDGTLRGERVRRGGRMVWEIDPVSAEQYISRHASAAELPPAASGPELHATADQGRTVPGAERPSVVQARWDAGVERGAWGRGDGPGLAELEEENAQLRAALAALTRAHQALVELVEVVYVEQPTSR